MNRVLEVMMVGMLLGGAIGACGQPEGEEAVGMIEMALETVPAEVTCVRVTAKGPYREKSVDVAVVPGPSMTQVLSGFPLGRVLFTAEAFAAKCESLTTRSTPSWLSDPVDVSVVDGTKTRVDFNMHRNGRLDVSFKFPEEPLCSAPGVACKSSKECCSNVCKTDACQAPAP